MTPENILDGADDRRTDPRYPMGYIPFAYHLVPLEGLAKVAAVMKAGEDRGDGWKEIPVEEHINHAISHMVAYLKGKHASHHLANAGCRILMALDLDKKEILPCHAFDPVRKSQKSQPSGLNEGDVCTVAGVLGKDGKELEMKVPYVNKSKQHTGWVEPEISDEVNLAHSVKETFDDLTTGTDD